MMKISLQENILRVRELMKITESSTNPKFTQECISVLKKEISSEIKNVGSNIPKAAQQIFNIDDITFEFQSWIFGVLPQKFEMAKQGKGGYEFAEQSYLKIRELIMDELDNLNFAEKGLIKVALPKKEEFIRQMTLNSPSNYDKFTLYFEYIINLRGVDNYDNLWEGENNLHPYKNNLTKFSDQVSDWVKKNKNRVIKEINQKVLDVFY